MTYAIKQNEPEGWEKAFEVTWNGKNVATFRYEDSAKAYVEDDVMCRRASVNIPACDYTIDMDQH